MTYQEFKQEAQYLEVLFRLNKTAEASKNYNDHFLNNKRHGTKYLKERGLYCYDKSN